MADDKWIVQRMSIAEIETLAKAGVKIDMNRVEIKNVEMFVPFDHAAALRPLLDRLRRAYKPAGVTDRYLYKADFPLVHMSAVEIGDAVHVWCVGPSGEPTTFKDDAKLYPSDALMANIHLYVETQPKRQPLSPGSIYAAQPADGWGEKVVSKFQQDLIRQGFQGFGDKI